MESRPAHNPLKRPVAIIFSLLSVGLVVVGIITSIWSLSIIGLLGVGYWSAVIVMMIRGRNPWWMRSGLDADASVPSHGSGRVDRR